MKNKEYGIIAPQRGEVYTLMMSWLKKFRMCSDLCIYGAGYRGRLLLKWLREEHIDVKAFIDNDIRLHGKQVDGLLVLSREMALERNYKMVISPYEYEEIEIFYRKKGYKENENYFIARKIEIPVVGIQKIFLANNLFQQIRENVDMSCTAPFPVYVGNEIVDYYKINTTMVLFDKVLDALIAEKCGSNIVYLPLYQKKGLILREWDELSEKILYCFRKYQIPVFFDSRLLEAGYSDIDVVRSNICRVKNEDDYFIVEQNYVFITNLLKYNDLSRVIPYIMQLQKNGINFMIARIPEFFELDNISDDEKFRNSNNITGYSRFYDNKEEQVKKVYGDDYEKWRKRQIGNIVQYYEGNIACLKDTEGECTNVINGIRRTTFQPEEYKNTIYILGPCIVGGAYVSDDNTIPSMLQAKLNSVYPNKYKVENMGICGGPCSYVERVKKLDLFRGDYLFFIDIFSKDFISQYDVMLIDLLYAFNRRVQDVFFEKPTHMNKAGNQLVCDEIFSQVVWKTDEYETGRQLVQKGNGMLPDMEKEFEEYRKKLEIIKKEIPEDMCNFGAIIMNCNPFTYGHLHLIKQAVKEVDYLFVFVVEEDKSFFPFEKRMKMVQEACKQFGNIKVLPSGKVILSSYTLPEYFRKEDLQDVIIDPAKDVEIFAKLIAPELKISKRFVGEEPFDTITKQYNECMKKVLPQNGIDLVEIPRLNIDGDIVSATKVRRWMEKEEYASIQKVVPESTYNVIKEMMG